MTSMTPSSLATASACDAAFAPDSICDSSINASNLNPDEPPLTSLQQQQSILFHLPYDILIYQILLILQDSDAFHLFHSCKHLYYKFLSKYHTKRVINMYDISFYPSFKLDSTRPLPIIERIRCEDLNILNNLRINRNHLRSITVKVVRESCSISSLPQSLTELNIWDLETPLIPNCLPSHLKQLGIHDIKCEQSWKVSEILPDTLQSLVIGNRVDYRARAVWMKEALQPHILPASLKSLETNYFFNNHPIGKNVLPISLEKLRFYTEDHSQLTSAFGIFPGLFNYPLLPGILPQSLKQLCFSFYFDHPLDKDVLPQSLEELHFGSNFNQPIGKNVLPRSLIDLRFGFSFNQPIDEDVLPHSLRELHFGYCFNQPLNKVVLLQSLQVLNFGFAFNQPIDMGVLPQSLEALRFGSCFNHPIAEGVLPQSLKELRLGCSNYPLNKHILPKSLATLHLGDSFNQPPRKGRLPRSLQELHFGVNFNCRIYKHVLPRSLKILHFGAKFNQSIGKAVLPPTLETLIFPLGSEFNQPLLRGVLPQTLQKLHLSHNFN